MKIQNIYIDKYKVFNDFDIDFRNNKGNIQNLIVLAGINGTGKTTLLNEVIKGNTELSTDHGFEDYSKVFGEITINTNGINETHQLPALTKNLATVVNRKEYISNIVYFSSGNDISNIFNVQNLIIRFVDDLIYTKNYRSFDAYAEDIGRQNRTCVLRCNHALF
ncbi:hypothetical protein FACS1894174_04680 [Bacteroidia bacterium]|nr:hypothetical protein FACS1894174_04680 [Bacteroidia bacterium]